MTGTLGTSTARGAWHRVPGVPCRAPGRHGTGWGTEGPGPSIHHRMPSKVCLVWDDWDRVPKPGCVASLWGAWNWGVQNGVPAWTGTGEWCVLGVWGAWCGVPSEGVPGKGCLVWCAWWRMAKIWVSDMGCWAQEVWQSCPSHSACPGVPTAVPALTFCRGQQPYCVGDSWQQVAPSGHAERPSGHNTWCTVTEGTHSVTMSSLRAQ